MKKSILSGRGKENRRKLSNYIYSGGKNCKSTDTLVDSALTNSTNLQQAHSGSDYPRPQWLLAPAKTITEEAAEQENITWIES